MSSSRKKTTMTEYIDNEIQLLEQFLKDEKSPDGSYYIKLRVQADALASIWQSYDEEQVEKDAATQVAGIKLFNRCAKVINEAHDQMKSVKDNYYFMSPAFKENYAKELSSWREIETARKQKNKEIEGRLMK